MAQKTKTMPFTTYCSTMLKSAFHALTPRREITASMLFVMGQAGGIASIATGLKASGLTAARLLKNVIQQRAGIMLEFRMKIL